jgi:hypothetical protein
MIKVLAVPKSMAISSVKIPIKSNRYSVKLEINV